MENLNSTKRMKIASFSFALTCHVVYTVTKLLLSHLRQYHIRRQTLSCFRHSLLLSFLILLFFSRPSILMLSPSVAVLLTEYTRDTFNISHELNLKIKGNESQQTANKNWRFSSASIRKRKEENLTENNFLFERKIFACKM